MFYFNWAQHILNMFLFIDLSIAESSEDNARWKYTVCPEMIAIKSFKGVYFISNNDKDNFFDS